MTNKKQSNKKNAISSVTLGFSDEGWEDYQHWRTTDEAVFSRINALITNALETPFTGIGKPEPLKANLTGLWSRRITKVDRLVYAFEDGSLIILQCRYHYE